MIYTLRTTCVVWFGLLCASHAFDGIYDTRDMMRDHHRATQERRSTHEETKSFESFYEKSPHTDAANVQHGVSLEPIFQQSPQLLAGEFLHRDKLNVLCLDGGGVRALATFILLAQLELKTNKRIHELFDHVYGTSTGGLGALLFAFGYSAPQVFDIYCDHMKDVFHRDFFDKLLNPLGMVSSSYGNEGLSRILNYYLNPMAIEAVQAGKNLKDIRALMDIHEKEHGLSESPVTLKEALINVGVVTEDYENHQTIMLSSDDPDTYDNLVLHAALATSAAPTYFPAQDVKVRGHTITCIDGGVAANNPSLQAYKHIKLNKLHMNPDFPNDKSKQKSIHILSLGTGYVHEKPLSRKTGKLGFATGTSIPHYFMSSASATIDGNMREIAARKSYFDYTRVSFELPERIDLADTSEHAKSILQRAVVSTLWDNKGNFGVYVKSRENDYRKHHTSEPILNHTSSTQIYAKL